MDFITMSSWAISPQFNSNLNKTHIINPKTLYLLPRNLYTIDLGLILTRISKNTIAKIEDTLPTCRILNSFWIASNATLTLTLVAEYYTVLSRGSVLCNAYLMPIECFVPGI